MPRSCKQESGLSISRVLKRTFWHPSVHYILTVQRGTVCILYLKSCLSEFFNNLLVAQVRIILFGIVRVVARHRYDQFNSVNLVLIYK